MRKSSGTFSSILFQRLSVLHLLLLVKPSAHCQPHSLPLSQMHETWNLCSELQLYSVNEANFPTWSEAIQDYFLDLKKPPAETSIESSTDSPLWPPPAPTQGMENQYTGALVADVHNVLTHGGVFAYPADLKNPNGKLRLLYEGNPMAMIVEQAGGVATTGFERIRDIRPQSVHHRIPAFFGSPDDVLPLLDPKYLHSRSR